MMVKLPTTILRYGVAIAAVALALLITLNVDRITGRMPFALFLAAVTIASWLGGRGPGLVALFLSAISADYFIIPHTYGLVPDLSGAFEITTFILVGFLINWLTTTLRRREKDVLENVTQRQFLFEKNPFPMWIFDLETLKFLAVNDAAIFHYGYTRADFLAMTIGDIRPADNVPALIDDVCRIDHTIEPTAIWKHLKKDGSVIDVEIVSHGLIFDGRPARLILGIDVTLRERERQRLNNIVESVPGVVWEAWGRPDGATQRIDFVSDYVKPMLGYSVEEWLSTPNFWLSIVHPDDREQAASGIGGAFARGENHIDEFRMIPKDGSPVWVEAHSATIMDESGTPVGIRGVTIDVTERKQAEIERHESESRYRALFESAPDGILIADPQSCYLDANDTICRMLGYSRDELTGMHGSDIVSFEDASSIASALTAIKSGSEYNRRWEFRRKDDSKFAGEVMVTAMPDGNLLARVRDVADREHAENERRVIFEIIQGSITTLNLDEFLTLVHRSISQIVYADNCYVMLHDPESNLMQFKFWVDTQQPVPSPIPVSSGFASYVLRTGLPMLVTNEIRKSLLESGEAEQIGSFTPSWLGVPLRTPSRTIGVLVLQHYEDEHAYSQSDLEFLSSIGDQIALAIERKRAEEALSESEERYRDLVENAIDIIYTHDLEGNYTSVNRAGERIMGYPREEALKLNLNDVVAPEYREKATRMITAKLASEELPAYDLEVIAKDGLRIPVEINTRVIYENGVPVSVQGIARDITERKKAEAALAEAEEKYRSLFENAVGGIFQSTPEGAFISVNPAMAQILGFESPEDLIARRRDIDSQHYVDENCRADLKNMLDGQGLVLGFECEVYRRDRSKIWTQESIRVVRDSTGQVLFYEGSIEDITERKHLEEQFRQAQKMEAVGMLAGGIAHDFNNLLTAINGYSDLTLRKLEADDPLCADIKQIREAGRRAAELTSQLLAFSRKQVLNPRVHNLNSVITELEKMLRRVIRESVEVELVLDPELGNIKADPGQIEQVIMNLAVNARDAMPDGGKLTIQTENVYLDQAETSQPLSVVTGPFVKMTVRDTGHGIDRETRRRMFEPFFTTKEVGKGSGLGLSTVHGIVMQSGGDIAVRSRPGYGTTFEVYLPCVDERIQVPQWIEGSVGDYSGTETILLVEDEEIVRNLVRAILRGNGYNVLEAPSGRRALSILDTYAETVHLLLTDMVMPGMSGHELRNHVKELRPDIKVLFMSGYTDDSLLLGGVLDSALIEKPFTPDGLSRRVREVLES